MLSRVLVSVASAVVWAAVVAGSASADPPPELTAYGRVIWNLDALLHDVFGRHRVYVNHSARAAPPRGDFSTRFIAEAASRYYVFTFAGARIFGVPDCDAVTA